jgi:hypothetical protein
MMLGANVSEGTNNELEPNMVSKTDVTGGLR